MIICVVSEGILYHIDFIVFLSNILNHSEKTVKPFCSTSCSYVLLWTSPSGTFFVILFVNPNFKFVKCSPHISISLTVPVKQCRCTFTSMDTKVSVQF